MSTEAELFSAILERPDEDAPRLVYADYLEERGRAARAELIRAQCALARLSRWEPLASALRHRIRVLLAHNGAAWVRDLGTIEGVTWGAFERGFVSQISVLDLDSLAMVAPEVRAIAPVEHVSLLSDRFLGEGEPEPVELPWVRSVALTGAMQLTPDELGQLMESGLAEGLQRLDLSGAGIENAGAEILAHATELANLEVLDLSECYVGQHGLEQLCGARHLGNLKELRFNSHGSGYVDDPFITDEAVEQLATDSHLIHLERLALDGNSISSAGLRALLESRHLTRLEAISLQCCNISPIAFEVEPGPVRLRSLVLVGARLSELDPSVAQRDQLRSLEHLNASGCGLSTEVIRALATGPVGQSLCELHLGRNRIEAEGAVALAAGSWPRLHTLVLDDNELGPEGAEALARGAFPALATLSLEESALAGGITRIASAPWAGHLRRLRVDRSGIPVEALASLSGLGALTELRLEGNKLGEAGARALATAHLPALCDLDLEQSGCTDAGVRALAQAGLLSSLLTLDLSGNQLTSAGLQALLDAAPAQLRELFLSHNRELSDAGLDLLLQTEALPSLISLGVVSCGISAEAMERLADSELVEHLRQLQFYGNRHTPELYERLRPLAWRTTPGPDEVSEDADPQEL